MNKIKILPALMIFAEVANKQSFTKAARQLGMSKSTVSQQLRRLEEHIGQQLLSRHTRGMSLTAAGRKLLSRCELLRDQVDLALEELNSAKETPAGPFSITIPHSCERDIVIPALSQLSIEFPMIEPKIVVNDEVLDLINNHLDVAIYGGELYDSQYRALPVGTVSEIFCATPAYVQKYGQANTPEDLHQHRMIATSWQSNTLDIFRNNNLSEKISIDVKYFARTNTLPGAQNMALQGMGVALLPEFTSQAFIANGELLRVLPDYQGWQWPFYMIHRFRGEKPIHVTRFYQLVKYFFSKANANIN